MTTHPLKASAVTVGARLLLLPNLSGGEEWHTVEEVRPEEGGGYTLRLSRNVTRSYWADDLLVTSHA